ncbi:phytoene desaturase family protein [Streptomyces sp. NPDC001667]
MNAPESVRVGRPLQAGAVREEYDAIVIGSGPGGLTTAVCLAKQGRAVAVFEQHYTAGGYTHAYRRRGWEWDIGIHYVGQLSAHEPTTALSDYLTEGALEWVSLGDPFDAYHLGGEVFTAPVGYKAYEAQLVERFPAERSGIKEFFRRIRRCRTALPIMALGRLSGNGAQRMTRFLEHWAPRDAFRPAREVVCELVQDAHLRQALLGATALLMVEDTATLPFMMLTFTFEHFRTGAWYPRGGSAQIARSMLPPIRRAGGEVFVRARVAEIMIKDGRVAGVVLQDGTRVHAPVVISNAGARNTFDGLLPTAVAEEAGYPQMLSQAKDAYSFLVLFVGLEGSPQQLGLPTHNVLVCEDDDCDTFYQQAPGSDRWIKSGLFISFSSAKDPTWPDRYPGLSTGEVIAYVRPEWFQDWAGTQWNKRGDAYLAEKERISKELLATLYRHLPHLEDKVTYYELATPLSAEHFGGWPNGTLYGFAINHDNLLRHRNWLRPRTKVPGLYISGQDALSGGFIGALGAGVLAAHDILGPVGKTRLWGSILYRTVRGKSSRP